MIRRRMVMALLLLSLSLLSLLCVDNVSAFQSSSRVVVSKGYHKQRGVPQLLQPQLDTSLLPTRVEQAIASPTRSTTSTSTTSLNMFMGSDGGLLGIGGPEIFTILLVGYFVLGPSDLFKLVKEIGKFLQNIRTLGTDLTTTFESNMNNVVELEELRKAQRELNDAFSFRRSINVEPESEAFSVQAGSAQKAMDEAEAAAAAAGSSTAAVATTTTTTTTTTKKKRRKIRRVVKKKAVPEEIPDLEMPPTSDPYFSTAAAAATVEDKPSELSAAEIAEIEKEFAKYTDDIPEPPTTTTTTTTTQQPLSTSKSWFDEDDALQQVDSKAATTTTPIPTPAPVNPQMAAAEQSRFQQQLSGNWNNQILENQDKLEPMAMIMNKIALLEKEKRAAVQRLEEEFQKRQELEMEFYAKQRSLLEEAAMQVQDHAFGLSDDTTNTNNKNLMVDAAATTKATTKATTTSSSSSSVVASKNSTAVSK